MSDLRQALIAARHWIYNGNPPIGWTIDRIDAALSAEPAQEVTAGIPWWQTAKDCGCWTDSDDTGLVHFGSTEALRVFVTKITAQAYQAGKLVALKPIVNKFGHELRPEIQRALEGSAEHLADRASRLPEITDEQIHRL